MVRDCVRLSIPPRELRLYRRESARALDPKDIVTPSLVRLELDRLFADASSRRALIELAGITGLLHTAEATDRARAWLEQALDWGRVIAVEPPVRRVIMQLKDVSPSIGPSAPAPPGEEWIEVMLFDSLGQPMPSSLDGQNVRFDVILADARKLPGGLPQEWKPIAGGAGSVTGIDGNPASACTLRFHDDFSDTVPAELPTPSDPQAPDPGTLAKAQGPINGPTLMTRRQLAATEDSSLSALPAMLNMTNVFQLTRQEAEVVELEHFNDGSAVFLPGAAPPSVYATGATGPLGIDVLAACLTFAQDYTVDQIIVTGHDANVSQQRADSVKALLVGDDASRTVWTQTAVATGTSDDVARVLHWAAGAFSWGCDPGDPDNPPNPPPQALTAALQDFKISYNTDVRSGLFPVVSPDFPLLEDSQLDPPAWGAIFDCYMRALRPVAGPPAAPPPDWAKYPISDDGARSGANAGRPQAEHPFVVVGTNGPGNAPITIAQYGSGSESNYMDLQPLNPQYKIGVDPEFVGQALNVPDAWADELAAAGYTVERDPLPPPPPPANPGPPALATPGPKAVGCGAHHLTTPWASAENRRTAKRHAEVAFLDSAGPVVCACGPGDGPCSSAVCELYDPREHEFSYIPPGADILRIRLHDTFGVPCSGVDYALTIGAKTFVGTSSEHGWVIHTLEAACPARCLIRWKSGDGGDYQYSLDIDLDCGLVGDGTAELAGKLRDMGYAVDRGLRDAVSWFQVDRGIEDTPMVGDQIPSLTRFAIREAFARALSPAPAAIGSTHTGEAQS